MKAGRPVEINPVRLLMNSRKPKPLLGWREWVALPGLGIERIKAKVDTGARTSALDIIFPEEFEENGVHKVRFQLRTAKGEKGHGKQCVADVLERRWVTDSGGGREHRVVIHTPVVIGSFNKAIEVTLTDRNPMTFRMLLGRTAIMREFNVNPGRSYLAGEPQGRAE